MCTCSTFKNWALWAMQNQNFIPCFALFKNIQEGCKVIASSHLWGKFLVLKLSLLLLLRITWEISYISLKGIFIYHNFLFVCVWQPGLYSCYFYICLSFYSWIYSSSFHYCWTKHADVINSMINLISQHQGWRIPASQKAALTHNPSRGWQGKIKE